MFIKVFERVAEMSNAVLRTGVEMLHSVGPWNQRLSIHAAAIRTAKPF
jgi:hypothetical protein